MNFRNLTNEEYWEKRAISRNNAVYKDAGKVEKALKREYKRALSEILEKHKVFIESNDTYVKASKPLSKTKERMIRDKLKKNISRARELNDNVYESELRKYLNSNKITRLERMIIDIDIILSELSHEEGTQLRVLLEESYAQNYYKTLYDIQHGLGIGVSFNLINERAVQEAVTYPWSGDMFIDNVWDGKRNLVKKLRQTITQHIIQGRSYQESARILAQEMDSGYGKSLRVIRTETSRIISESTHKAYEESRTVKEYKYIAVLDNKTSRVCQDLDGRIFKVEERQIGKNSNPMHPNCRSTTRPYFRDLQTNLGRRARGEDGKTYIVPSNMNYHQWYHEYVEKKGKDMKDHEVDPEAIGIFKDYVEKTKGNE